jgi:hypothetical protein
MRKRVDAAAGPPVGQPVTTLAEKKAAPKKSRAVTEAPIAEQEPALRRHLSGRAIRAAAINSMLDESGARSTFGGRVEIKSDPGSLLRGYYKSLEIAGAMLRKHPQIAGAVKELLEGVSIGEKHRPLLAVATGMQGGDIVEPARPLGTNSPTLTQFRAITERAAGSEKWLTPSDSNIEKVLFADGGLPKDLSKYLTHRTADVRDDRPALLSVLRVYARAKERGVPGMTVSDWAEVTRLLESDRAETAVLERLVKAYEADRSQIIVQGRRMTELHDPRPSSWRPQSPLGDVSRYAADPSDEGNDVWDSALDQELKDAFYVDDETIHRRLGFCDYELTTMFLSKMEEPEDKLELFRICARVHELGYPNVIHQYSLKQHLDALPPTQEAADVVRYVARLEDWEEDDDREIGRVKLSSFPPSRGLPPPEPEEPLGPPLGDIEILEDEVDSRIARADRELLKLSNECILRVVEGKESALVNPPKSAKRGIEWTIGALRLVSRALRLGAEIGGLEKDLQDFFDKTIDAKNLSNPRVLEEVARICRHSDASPYQIFVKPGLRLYHFKPFVEAEARLDHRILGAKASVDERGYHQPGPLGTTNWKSSLPPPDLELDDDSIRYLIGRGDFDIVKWLEHWKSPRVFLVAARVFELIENENEHRQVKWGVWHYLKKPIPDSLVTEESIPWIARLAKAFGAYENELFAPEAVRVRQKPGATPIPLTKHPKYADAMIASRKEVQQAVNAAWKALDPNAAGGDDARTRAVVRLIAGDRPPVELAQIMPGLVERAMTGRIARIPATDEALAALSTWGHIGAMSVLASLLTEATKEQIADLLRAKGFDDEQVETWSQIATRLRSIEPRMLGYVLARIVGRQSPDFTTIDVRLALAEKPDLSPIEGEIAQDDSRAIECARALIDRVLAEEGDEARRRTLSLIDGAVERGLITAREMRIAAQNLPPLDPDKPESWPLFAARVEPVLEAITAHASEGNGGLHELEQAIERLTVLADPPRVARLVLRHAYAEDLKRVAPLASARSGGSNDTIATAMSILGRMANDYEEAMADLEGETLDWLPVAVERASGEQWTEDALVGLAAAAAEGWVPISLLAHVRNQLPEELVTRAWNRVRSSKARAVLENRPRSMRPVLQIVAPHGEPPAEQATVSRGHRAPTGDLGIINRRFQR